MPAACGHGTVVVAQFGQPGVPVPFAGGVADAEGGGGLAGGADELVGNTRLPSVKSSATMQFSATSLTNWLAGSAGRASPAPAGTRVGMPWCAMYRAT